MRSPAALAALLLASAASAEICGLDGSRQNPAVRRLAGPRCEMNGNALVFDGFAGSDDKFRTFVTDDWPGWFGADQKCQAALRGLDSIRSAYVVTRTMVKPQIWRFRTSCQAVAADFADNLAKLRKPGEPKPVAEALKASGGKELSPGELAERLIEGKPEDEKD